MALQCSLAFHRPHANIHEHTAARSPARFLVAVPITLIAMTHGRRAHLGAALLAALPLATSALVPVESFVTRSGAQLMADGKPFRFGGANV